MIVTLTPNPSLDLTYELAGLSRGAVHRAETFSVEAGGKGINVSRGLVANGIASRAVVPVGDRAGSSSYPYWTGWRPMWSASPSKAPCAPT